MLAKVFKAYDVRGIYPSPLNEDLAWRIGYGAAQFFLGRASGGAGAGAGARTVVVGRDMRKSSPSMVAALKQGLKDAGADVVDVGMVDTPFVGFAVNQLGAAGGVQTTASHNPANYNGFKFCAAGAKPIGADTGLQEIQRLAALAERGTVQAKGGGEAARDLWAEYRAHLLKFMPAGVMSGSRPLHVVIDASNGMAGTMVPKVFDGVEGLKITRINFDNSTGEFVHEPNPLVEANLKWVRESVVQLKADFGVCFDGDADRCMVVDERGQPIGCDLLTAWLGQGWLKRERGAAIVYDLRSTRALPESVSAAGGKPVECRVGHVFMKQKLRETNAPFGGELSGHFYYRDMWFTDNGARAFIDVMASLVDSGRSVGECIKPFRCYAQSGEINFENADKEGALAALRSRFPGAKVATLDGLSLNTGPWWCNVRMSNTEPLLRLNLEARDPQTVASALADVAPLLGKRVDH
jgi:phosphomannomutase